MVLYELIIKIINILRLANLNYNKSYIVDNNNHCYYLN